MKRQRNLIWLVGLLLASTFSIMAQEAKTNPMKKGDLVKALESNLLPSKELIERIQQRGVDFELNDKTETELKNAGANSDVIAAVRGNYKAVPKKKGLFGKMGDGLSKAASKAKETVEKTGENSSAKSETTEDRTESTAQNSTAAKTTATDKPNTAEKTTPTKSVAGTLQPPIVGGFPKIVGTGWKIIEIYTKGTKPKGGRNVVPTFVFCKSSRWEIVRYGLTPGNAGAVGQVGTYKVSGGMITTKNDTDGLVANYKMNWLAGENILELDEGSSVIMRLQYNGESTCNQ
jgi:hypothetical protein